MLFLFTPFLLCKILDIFMTCEKQHVILVSLELRNFLLVSLSIIWYPVLIRDSSISASENEYFMVGSQIEKSSFKRVTEVHSIKSRYLQHAFYRSFCGS